MSHITTDLYKNKRALMNFIEPLVKDAGRPISKFVADMIFGILTSQTINISQIARCLHEKTKLHNTVERLCRNLSEADLSRIINNYLLLARQQQHSDRIYFVDDTDIIKPYGFSFEDIGMVRDGSASSANNTVIQKGYMCTEIVALSAKNKQPYSVFSHIYSQMEEDFKSTNAILDTALEDIFATLARPATFVFDRAFDRSDLYELFFRQDRRQNFIVRIKTNRNVIVKTTNGDKKILICELVEKYKGKIKAAFLRWNSAKSRLEKHEYKISTVSVTLPDSEHTFMLVLAYPLVGEPLILGTNCPISSKKDAIDIVQTYFQRWRIEEYFRLKKVSYDFEGFRVRSLNAINNLNLLLGFALFWIACLAAHVNNPGHYAYALRIYAKALRYDVSFYGYQISNGLAYLFRQARAGPAGYYPPTTRRRRGQVEMTIEDLLNEIAIAQAI